MTVETHSDERFLSRWPGRVRFNGATLYEITSPNGQSFRAWTNAKGIQRIKDRKGWVTRYVDESEYDGPTLEAPVGQMNIQWHERAACRSLPRDWFFPGAGADEPLGDEAPLPAAREACLGCPVRRDCLRQALTWNEQYGLWGGLTPGERASLRGSEIRELLGL